MTVSLGEAIKIKRQQFTFQFIPPIMDMKKIVVIIPVKDNQTGIDNLLASFFKNTAPLNAPKAIIIVDNNSKAAVKYQSRWRLSTKIDIISCEKQGPAAARNAGAHLAIAKYNPDWLFFYRQ